MVAIFLFALVAIQARALAPHNPLAIHGNSSYLPAAWVRRSATTKSGSVEFLLGTDGISRDVLSRLIYGARVSPVVGLVPAFIIFGVGTAVGLLSGYLGGRVDNIAMRITDLCFALPDLQLYILLTATLRDTAIGKWLGGLFVLFVALALVSWVGIARLVRALTLGLREQPFIESARCVGVPTWRIMVRHILPNIAGPLAVATTLIIPRMIIVEAVLGYLGLGLRPAVDPESTFISSWGSLMLEGQSAIAVQPWLLLSPAISLAILVLSFTLIGDGLHDTLDPHAL